MFQTGDQRQKMWDTFIDFHYHCDTHRFQKIIARAELIRMVAQLPGDILDAGVFKGSSSLEFAHMIEIFNPHSRSRVYAFDTFEATFPDPHDYEKREAERHAANFDPKAYAHIEEAIKRLGLQKRLELVKGDIVKTLPQLLDSKPGLRSRLVHCDLDIYEPTIATLQNIWPRVVLGGVIAFDEYGEYNWGESNAVDDFLKTLEAPPKLRILDLGPSPTAYIIKESY